MAHVTLVQRAFWVALVTAAAPYAFFRLTRHPLATFDGEIALDDIVLDERDVYDDLRDGEVAAAG